MRPIDKKVAVIKSKIFWSQETEHEVPTSKSSHFRLSFIQLDQDQVAAIEDVVLLLINDRPLKLLECFNYFDYFIGFFHAFIRWSGSRFHIKSFSMSADSSVSSRRIRKVC